MSQGELFQLGVTAPRVGNVPPAPRALAVAGLPVHGAVRLSVSCRCGSKHAQDHSTWVVQGVEVYDPEIGDEARLLRAAPEPGIATAVRCRRCGTTTGGLRHLATTDRRVSCGAICREATGHDCTCSCGGANHGSGVRR